MGALLQSLKGLLPLSILVFILSFYHFDPTIETGLDPSYAFGLNYIFAHGIPFGTEIIYTYGPLGFLYFPQDIQHNLLLGIVLVSLLRFAFIYCFLLLGSKLNKGLWWLHSTMALFICCFVYLDFVLVSTATIAVFLHFFERKNFWLVLAVCISIIALFIKSSFGLLCASILFSYSIYDFVKQRKIETIVVLLLSALTAIFLLWMLIYRTFDGLGLYLYGTWQLSAGNSSAMIIEVNNNWWLLSAFALLFFLVPFIANDKTINLLYFCSFLALYAAWKYAFSREENYHLKFFFDYLIVFAILLVLLSKSFQPRATAILLLSILLFYQSMKATGNYNVDESISFSGPRNFSRILFSWDKFTAEANQKSNQNLQKKILPKVILDKVGQQSIDFFPWELTYAAANSFNWKPRPNMQSGAYTPWLDKNNANFISSKNGAQFILWELDKPNGGVDCFDSRHFYNDEPFTIFAIFNKYKLCYADSSYALFERRTQNRFSLIVEGTPFKAPLNKWIKLPSDSSAIVRAEVDIKNTWQGNLRKALFKDIIYFIDYQLLDGSNFTYRIVRDNAANGLWVNPLVRRVTEEVNGKKVTAIRFHSSNNSLVEDSISVRWQILTLAKNQQALEDDN